MILYIMTLTHIIQQAELLQLMDRLFTQIRS
nr:MAG TPA: hypothetical protein [Bacteriophage sp.]